MPLLGSMNDYSPWHCSLMEPGSAVAGHRGRNPLWPGGQSTTGQQTHHSSTCSYHFGSTELACFLEIAQPPRVSTQEWENTQTPFSLWLFAIQRSADALQLCFMSFFKEEKIKPWPSFNLKMFAKLRYECRIWFTHSNYSDLESQTSRCSVFSRWAVDGLVSGALWIVENAESSISVSARVH